jgi:hypothetical protein
MGRSRSPPSRSTTSGGSGSGSVTSASDLRRTRPEYGFCSGMPKIARPAFSPGRFLDIRYSRDFREALDNVSLRDTGVPFALPALRRARPAPSALGAAKNNR